MSSSSSSAQQGAHQPAPRSSWFVATLVILCIALAVIELVLVRENRELSAQVRELDQRVQAAERSPVPALEGRPFPALALLDSRGQHLGLDELAESHATLLFVSSSACDYCELAAPTWERVHCRLAGTSLRVLGLVLDAEPADLDPASVPYPLLAPGTAGPELERALPGVPAALFLDSSGVVLRAIYGGEQIGLEQAVEDFL